MRLQMLADKSRMKRPTNTKINRKVAHQFPSQRSKVKVTRSTNAETGHVSHLPDGKAYELETW